MSKKKSKDFRRLIKHLAKYAHQLDIWEGHVENKPWWRLSLEEQSIYIRRAENSYANISL